MNILNIEAFISQKVFEDGGNGYGMFKMFILNEYGGMDKVNVVVHDFVKHLFEKLR